MDWAFEGYTVVLEGINFAYYQVSQAVGMNALNTTKFVFVIIPKIRFAKLALGIAVLIFF